MIAQVLFWVGGDLHCCLMHCSKPTETAAILCVWVVLLVVCIAAVPIALPNTVSPGGYTETWAAGLRAPSITVALSDGWANATLQGWTMGLNALFPQQ